MDFKSIQNILRPELNRLNAFINEALTTASPLMNEVVSRYLLTKGKQIRPIMVILSAKLLGQVNDNVLHAAAALEMLHNASLIHDDVVDDTRRRRGTETINAIWDNHIAVLVGDFFVSNALAEGIKTGSMSIISSISDLGKELSLGEIDQICNARSHAFREEDYFKTIRQKTASLFMQCASVGARAAGAQSSQIAILTNYAELLGLCFQIKDDIFDYFDDALIGKPTGNDLREGKVTLPLLYALRNTSDQQVNAMRNIIKRGNLSEQEISNLIDFAKERGGIDYAYVCMKKMQQSAEEIIMTFPTSEAREALREIFTYIISRDK